MIYDAIIIGGGPSGLTCALYLLRANKNVLVLDKKTPMSKVESLKLIENYPGFASISGKDLSTHFVNQITNINSSCIRKFNVTKVFKSASNWAVSNDLEILEAKNVVIATGVNEKEIIPNTNAFLGKGISYCISCDGFFYRNKKVILIGSSEELKKMKDEFSSLTNFIKCIDVKDLKNPQIIGNEYVSGLINNEKSYECDGIFINPMYSKLNLDIELELTNNFIITDKNFKTKEKGLYAIGDIVDKPLRQISTAVNDGAIAATDIIKNL